MYGWNNKRYESIKKVLSKEKLACLQTQGQIPLLISAVKLIENHCSYTNKTEENVSLKAGRICLLCNPWTCFCFQSHHLLSQMKQLMRMHTVQLQWCLPIVIQQNIISPKLFSTPSKYIINHTSQMLHYPNTCMVVQAANRLDLSILP